VIDTLADYSSWSSWTRAATVLALDVALKATALCLITWSVGSALGRRRVLARSALWNASLAGLLVLPVAGTVFPRLPMAFLAQLSSAPSDDERRATAAAELGPSPANAGTDADARPAEGPSLVRPGPAPVVSDDGGRIGLAETAPPAWLAAIDVTAIAMMVYAAVAGFLLARLAFSYRAVSALRRSSVAMNEPAWTAALSRWQARLDVRHPVRLARSGKVAVPIVIGWPRPTIIVPERLGETPRSTVIDAVLLHELAHVRRGDYAWNLLSRLVRIIYWPHPLVWLSGREIAAVREQACDDLCVYLMNDAQAYRLTLAELAAGLLRRPGEALGMAMADRSKLARRLTRIGESAGQPRCTLSWPARSAVIVVVLAVCGLLGCLRPGHAAAASEEGADPSAAPAQQNLIFDRATGNQVFAAFQQGDDDQSTKAAVADQSVHVMIAKVERGDFQVTTTQPGTLIASREVEIHSRVTGFVAECNAEIGVRVKKGELLAVIEAPDLDAEMEQAEEMADEAAAQREGAEARVDVAKAVIESDVAKVAEAKSAVKSAQSSMAFREKVHHRLATLSKTKVLDERVLDEDEDKLEAARESVAAAKAKAETAQAGMSQSAAGLREAEVGLRLAASRQKAAERRLERSRLHDQQRRIVAPFDGVVSETRVNVGDFVRGPAENKPLFVVLTTERVVVVVQVPHQDVALLDRGDPATIRLGGGPGQELKGEVSRTGYVLDPKTRTMRVEIDLPNPDGRLRAGMYGDVTIVLETHPSALTVPANAFFQIDGGGTHSCYRVVNGRAVKTAIKLGRRNTEKATEIVEGLTAGETVVTGKAGARLADGQEVEIVDRLPVDDD